MSPTIRRKTKAELGNSPGLESIHYSVMEGNILNSRYERSPKGKKKILDAMKRG